VQEQGRWQNRLLFNHVATSQSAAKRFLKGNSPAPSSQKTKARPPVTDVCSFLVRAFHRAVLPYGHEKQ
jgi:hypothetical protein